MPPADHLTVLFLQGHPSLFWTKLGDGVARAGHNVLKVNFCLADRIFWRRPNAVNYRGRFSKWEAWLRDYLVENNVTDIFYYADRLPYHALALDVAKPLGIRCWAIEFGYLRPDWITFEPEAMGARSTFPKDRASIEALARKNQWPDLKSRYNHSFPQEAFLEVSFNLIAEAGWPLYPFYKADKVYWPVYDYLAWLVVLTGRAQQAREAREVEERALSGAFPYNLIAMQLQADYQIRASSQYDHLEEFLEEVFVSFAAHAPRERRLIVKLHPLDNGIEKWPKRAQRLAEKHGLRGRVDVIRGGHLGHMIRASSGAIYVNSTVGMHSLLSGTPSIAMGEAVFDIEGLTHQRGIDTFWTDPDPVDVDYAKTYVKALMDIQIRGSFFSEQGQDAAIAEIVRRINRLTPTP